MPVVLLDTGPWADVAAECQRGTHHCPFLQASPLPTMTPQMFISGQAAMDAEPAYDDSAKTHDSM